MASSWSSRARRLPPTVTRSGAQRWSQAAAKGPIREEPGGDLRPAPPKRPTLPQPAPGVAPRLTSAAPDDRRRQRRPPAPAGLAGRLVARRPAGHVCHTIPSRVQAWDRAHDRDERWTTANVAPGWSRTTASATRSPYSRSAAASSPLRAGPPATRRGRQRRPVPGRGATHPLPGHTAHDHFNNRRQTGRGDRVLPDR